MHDNEARNFIRIVFESFKNKNPNISNIHLLKNIIDVYLTYVEKTDFEIIVEDYKDKYILNESQVEENFTIEEQLGIGEMYDYIKNFDYKKDKFNLFVTSLILHSKLYSKCQYPEFGGKLRDTTAYLFDTNYEVADPEVAKKYFNDLIPTSDQIFEPLTEPNSINYFAYIDNCIKETTDLIKMQPFADGNKRTFRALLNLLLKKINIPPIYINKEERLIYKEALLSAINDNDYSLITHFYYYKICSAIMILDIDRLVIKEEKQR